MIERVTQKIDAARAAGALSAFGPLSGLWRSGQSGTTVVLWEVNGNLLEHVVNPQTGRLTLTGVAERVQGRWRGWLGVACRQCCPGVTWWDRGIVVPSADRKTAVERILTKKMDPATCLLTTTPDDISVNMTAVRALSFGRIAAGGYVYVISTPAVGPNRAQFKGLVRLRWDLRNLGVRDVEIVATAGGAGPGSRFVPRTRDVAGEREFVTDQPGRFQFAITAWNAEGHPLHFERISIAIGVTP